MRLGEYLHPSGLAQIAALKESSDRIEDKLGEEVSQELKTLNPNTFGQAISRHIKNAKMLSEIRFKKHILAREEQRVYLRYRRF